MSTELFETVENLHSNLADPGLVIVDCRSFAEYSKAHIPGSVNVELMQFHWLDTSDAGVRAFNRQARQLLSNLGVSKSRRVVFYDNVSGSSAARGVWLLLYFSHNNVAMLDGGLEIWKNKGYQIQKKANSFRPTKFRGRPNKKLLTGAKDLALAIKENQAVIIDARSHAEYRGSVARAARAGHIPGAMNINWTKNLTGARFKRRAALKGLYSKIPRSSKVVTYCQGGFRAANSFVVLKELGFKDVSMYLGSWGEWGNNFDLPVSTKLDERANKI